jgi:hypothetical protein
LVVGGVVAIGVVVVTIGAIVVALGAENCVESVVPPVIVREASAIVAGA